MSTGLAIKFFIGIARMGSVSASSAPHPIGIAILFSREWLYGDADRDLKRDAYRGAARLRPLILRR